MRPTRFDPRCAGVEQPHPCCHVCCFHPSTDRLGAREHLTTNATPKPSPGRHRRLVHRRQPHHRPPCSNGWSHPPIGMLNRGSCRPGHPDRETETAATSSYEVLGAYSYECINRTMSPVVAFVCKPKIAGPRLPDPAPRSNLAPAGLQGHVAHYTLLS